MSLSINLPDKILAGVNQSYTLSSESGAPAGKVLVDGSEVEHRIIPLGPPKEQTASQTPLMKYKLTFLLPDGSAGKKLELKFQAGANSAEEAREITAD